MLRRFCVLSACGLFSSLPAEAGDVSLGMSGGMVYSVGVPSGSRAPPRLAHGLSLALPTKHLLLIADIGFSTGLTQFDPSPTLIVGGSHHVGNIGLGISAAYIWAPPYEGASAHLAGISIVPAVPLVEKRVTLIVPVGPTWNLTNGALSVGCAVKLVITP